MQHLLSANLLDKPISEHLKWNHFHVENNETNPKILENVEGLHQRAQ